MSTDEECSKQKKAEDFSSAFPACTLPQVLCQTETYCKGATVPSQVVSVALPTRTTASANEQK